MGSICLSHMILLLLGIGTWSILNPLKITNKSCFKMILGLYKEGRLPRIRSAAGCRLIGRIQISHLNNIINLIYNRYNQISDKTINTGQNWTSFITAGGSILTINPCNKEVIIWILLGASNLIWYRDNNKGGT